MQATEHMRDATVVQYSETFMVTLNSLITTAGRETCTVLVL